MTTEEIQAGDLLYASGQLGELAGKAGPDSAEGKSLDVTIEWLERQAESLDSDGITAIPPVR